MFDLSQNSLKNKTLTGLAVTFFVASTACSHQAVKPANNDSDPTAVSSSIESTPTPEPLSSPSPLSAPAKKSAHRHSAKSAKFAKAHKKGHVILAKGKAKLHKTKTVTPVAARIESQSMTPPPAALGTVSDMIQADSTTSNPGFWERALDYWPFGLIGLGAFAAAWIFAKPRGKRRGLIFNG